jgi:hypothetical protein
MAGSKPDYRVFVSRQVEKEGEDPDNFYTDVGAAWKVAKGGISIQLQALPTDGKLVLFPPKAKD